MTTVRLTTFPVGLGLYLLPQAGKTALLTAWMLRGRLIHEASQLCLPSPCTDGRNSLHLFTYSHINCNRVLEVQLVYTATSPFCTVRSIILLLRIIAAGF